MSGFDVSADNRSIKSLLFFAERIASAASGFSTKLISIKLLKLLPNCRMEKVFPVCRAPVISNAFRVLA